jgi:hypothetical protein
MVGHWFKWVGYLAGDLAQAVSGGNTRTGHLLPASPGVSFVWLLEACELLWGTGKGQCVSSAQMVEVPHRSLSGRR